MEISQGKLHAYELPINYLVWTKKSASLVKLTIIYTSKIIQDKKTFYCFCSMTRNDHSHIHGNELLSAKHSSNMWMMVCAFHKSNMFMNITHLVKCVWTRVSYKGRHITFRDNFFWYLLRTLTIMFPHLTWFTEMTVSKRSKEQLLKDGDKSTCAATAKGPPEHKAYSVI